MAVDVTADMLLMELVRQYKENPERLVIEWGATLRSVQITGLVDLEELAEAINREAGE